MASAHNVTELIIAGLFQDPDVQRACFLLFLPVYLATVVGNGLIVGTVSVSRSLRSPMYFFLGHLSLVEICYSSTVVPKFITDLLATVKTISLKGCLTQIFFFHFFGVAEILLLTVMAYDRYVAICKPLYYTTIMSRPVCHRLVAGSWLGGFFHSIIQIFITLPLPFCGPHVIDHYFCDLHPLFKLACTDTFVVGVIMFVNSGLFSVFSFLFLVCSYVVILAHLRTRSAEGRRKALSTCASHITVVVLFFGPAIFLYLRPSSTYTEDKLVAVFYTVITPMLNPIIYTLRNAEVKISMRRLWGKAVDSSNWYCQKNPDCSQHLVYDWLLGRLPRGCEDLELLSACQCPLWFVGTFCHPSLSPSLKEGSYGLLVEMFTWLLVSGAWRLSLGEAVPMHTDLSYLDKVRQGQIVIKQSR
ncbi:olfactory receptor 4B1-like [Ctenodactylus gundi]